MQKVRSPVHGVYTRDIIYIALLHSMQTPARLSCLIITQHSLIIMSICSWSLLTLLALECMRCKLFFLLSDNKGWPSGTLWWQVQLRADEPYFWRTYNYNTLFIHTHPDAAGLGRTHYHHQQQQQQQHGELFQYRLIKLQDVYKGKKTKRDWPQQ